VLSTGCEVLSRAGEVAREFCVVFVGRSRAIGSRRYDGAPDPRDRAGSLLGRDQSPDGVARLSDDRRPGGLRGDRPEHRSAARGDRRQPAARRPDPGAFVARRALLIGLAAGLRLVGSRLSPDTLRLREFLARNRIPHGFVDVERDEPAEALLRELGVAPSETPLLLGGPLALRTRRTARWRRRA
jgi:hypothetical protein